MTGRGEHLASFRAASCGGGGTSVIIKNFTLTAA